MRVVLATGVGVGPGVNVDGIPEGTYKWDTDGGARRTPRTKLAQIMCTLAAAVWHPVWDKQTRCVRRSDRADMLGARVRRVGVGRRSDA